MFSARLLVALARLNENQREAFLDRHLCGRSDREIAQTMGISKARVWQLCERASDILAEALQ